MLLNCNGSGKIAAQNKTLFGFVDTLNVRL